MALVLKTSDPARDRGFESLSLRQIIYHLLINSLRSIDGLLYSQKVRYLRAFLRL